MRPPAASTNRRARVAMPDSRCRKLSAVRSPTSSARAAPTTSAISSPGAHRSPSLLPRGRLRRRGSSWRNASNATSRPATTQSAFTRNTPRARCGRRHGRVGGDVAARRRPRRARAGRCRGTSAQSRRDRETSSSIRLRPLVAARRISRGSPTVVVERLHAERGTAGRLRHRHQRRPTSASALTVTFVIGTFSGCFASERCLRTSNSTSVAQS